MSFDVLLLCSKLELGTGEDVRRGTEPSAGRGEQRSSGLQETRLLELRAVAEPTKGITATVVILCWLLAEYLCGPGRWNRLQESQP